MSHAWGVVTDFTPLQTRVHILSRFLNFQVILTADVSGNHGSRIFFSDDFGKSFTPQELPFFPFMQITYNPENSNVLMALSNKVCSGYALDVVYLQFRFSANLTSIYNDM